MVRKLCKNNQRGRGRGERGRSICTVLYQTDIDDLPEDFLIDVVELQETLLLTCGCGHGVGGRTRLSTKGSEGEMLREMDEKCRLKTKNQNFRYAKYRDMQKGRTVTQNEGDKDAGGDVIRK